MFIILGSQVRIQAGLIVNLLNHFLVITYKMGYSPTANRKKTQTFIKRKVYHEPERGGLRIENKPEIIPFDSLIDIYREITDDQKTDFFIDTCCFELSLVRQDGHDNDMDNSLFSYYVGVMDYLPDPIWRAEMSRLYEQYGRWNEFCSDELLTRDNVFIIAGVLVEIHSAKTIAKQQSKRSSCPKGTRKFLLPIERFYEAAKNNHERMLRLEDSSAYGSILDMIPKDTVFGPLSETDRSLLAVPLATALDDGRKKVVFTNDKTITRALGDLGRRTLEENVVENLDGFPRRAKNVRIAVYSIVPDIKNKMYRYSVPARYSNFFNTRVYHLKMAFT